MRWAFVILLLVACRSDVTIAGKTPANEGTETGDPGDGGSEGETPLPPDEWCLDFEDGSLVPVGYEGDFVEREDGGLVLVAEEGDEFSALWGEELLDFGGTHALVLRSSHAGEVTSSGVATTAPFEVSSSHLRLWQLAEVDESGISFLLELLDPVEDRALASQELPVETGGFVPALLSHHAPIPGFPDITTESYTPGVLVELSVDVRAFGGQTVRLRLTQNTRVDNNGFFTVIDDLCHGAAAETTVVLAGSD